MAVQKSNAKKMNNGDLYRVTFVSAYEMHEQITCHDKTNEDDLATIC